MRLSSLFTFFILLLCCELQLQAQQNQLRAYTQEDGLPQSQVYDILEDEVGYLWLGTQGGGLCRFDGDAFEIWKKNDGLASNYIHALMQQGERIFIGTASGLSIKSKAGFTNFEAPQVNTFLERDRQIFIGTNAGIYVFGEDQKLKKLNLGTAIDTAVINDLYFDGNFFWVATNKALWKLRDFIPAEVAKGAYETSNFTAINGVGNTVFAATYTDGILVINSETGSETDGIITRPQRINDLSILEEGQLWVSTDNSGVSVIDIATKQVLRRIDQNNGLSVSHVRKSMRDSHSNIWLATSGGGLFKYFQNNFKHYDKDTGLKGNRVYAVHAIQNDIWASNAEKGLVKIDSTGIYHIPIDERFKNTKIKTITSDAQGGIWVGSDGKGILYRTRQLKDSLVISGEGIENIKIDTVQVPGIFNRVFDTDDGLPSNWMRKVLIRDRDIWAATYSDGIVKMQYDIAADSLLITKKFGVLNGIEDVLLTDMNWDDTGRLWYASQNGHIGYIENDKVTHLGDVLERQGAIYTLLFHKEHLYLGTAGNGIWWADKNATSAFKKIDGAFTYSNTIYQLIFDDQGALWAGTENGVDKLVLNQEHQLSDVFHFGRNDGFLGIETCRNAVAKDETGNLWFGAIYGLTTFQNYEAEQLSKPPSIHFEEVAVAYKNIDSLDLKKWESGKRVLQLKPNQKQLNFKYRSVDLDHPKDIQYRFKLNKDAWSPWTTEAQQNFSGLAYGKHNFTAQSRNFRWEESAPISFVFFIERPLYLKPWFQWLVGSIIALLLLSITYVYIRNIKRRNAKERERLQMQNHLLSLEQKALRLQMNPHFIFNVLNGIKAMGASNPEKMGTTVNTFAVLLRDTLNNSRKDTITLDQEIKTIKHYIEVELLMAQKPFEYTIKAPSELDAEEILIPPMLIQPFVENAIRHGILKGERPGELSIIFEAEGAFLSCQVTDNGMGIFESQKTATPKDHQSLALTVTRERIESLSGKDSLQIKEIVTDQGVQGTQVNFKIPLETDY